VKKTSHPDLNPPGCHVSLLKTKVWWILVLVGCQIITFGEIWRDSFSLSLFLFWGQPTLFPVKSEFCGEDAAGADVEAPSA